jgi:arylsulfatase A-like enzyme
MKWPAGWEPIPSPDEICQQVDVMPTVLKRLELPFPRKLEGHVLGEVKHPVVCELYRNPGNIKLWGARFDRKLRAVFSESYKLIVSSKEGDPDAGLFDLASDPDEADNLARSMPEKAAELLALFERFEQGLTPPLAPRRIESLDPKTERQLKEMGYGH